MNRGGEAESDVLRSAQFLASRTRELESSLIDAHVALENSRQRETNLLRTIDGFQVILEDRQREIEQVTTHMTFYRHQAEERGSKLRLLEKEVNVLRKRVEQLAVPPSGSSKNDLESSAEHDHELSATTDYANHDAIVRRCAALEQLCTTKSEQLKRLVGVVHALVTSTQTSSADHSNSLIRALREELHRVSEHMKHDLRVAPLYATMSSPRGLAPAYQSTLADGPADGTLSGSLPVTVRYLLRQKEDLEKALLLVHNSSAPH